MGVLPIASIACAASQTTAAALAASKGWRSLVTPAVMCSVFGYVIAKFVGVFLGGWFGVTLADAAHFINSN